MSASLIKIHPINRVLVGLYDLGSYFRPVGDGGAQLYISNDMDWNDRERDFQVKNPQLRDRWAIILATTTQTQEHGSIFPGQKALLGEMRWSMAYDVPLPDGTRGKVWAIEDEHILAVDDSGFSDLDKQRITTLYPGWEDWKIDVV